MTKILFYDIETTYLEARIWRCGEQVVRHDQLKKNRDSYDVICITYCYNDGKPAQVLDWGYEEQESKGMLAHFDSLIREADVVIGKNSDRFDNKHLNMHRMFNQQPGMADWTKYTDDLEKQFRKHFGQALPSQSLDYISGKLGLGGKIKMEFSDWVDIVEKTKNGPKAFAKMLKYGKKDVEDTRAIWNFASAHLTPKFSRKETSQLSGHVCMHCNGHNLVKNGVRKYGGQTFQRFHCNDCHSHAGRKVI